MLIIIPIFRNNAAGRACAGPGKPLEAEGGFIQLMFVNVTIVWFFSCCTAFAFNKNDFKREFTYETLGKHWDVNGHVESVEISFESKNESLSQLI